MSTEENNEEVQETVETGTGEKTEKKSLEDLTPAEVIAYAREKGREAAKYRTKANELSTEVERLKPFELETMSEVDRLKAEKEALLESLRPYKEKESKADVAKAVGLHENYVDLIVGKTTEEMTEHAKKLAATLPAVTVEEKKKETAVDFFGGTAGKQPISGESGETFFEDLMAGKYNT